MSIHEQGLLFIAFRLGVGLLTFVVLSVMLVSAPRIVLLITTARPDGTLHTEGSR